MFGLNKKELTILKRLATPAKIQDCLDTLAINFEVRGETVMSPRRVLREHRAHCLEGALLAALALRIHGQKPLVMDLRATDDDDRHAVALFRQYGRWGGITKTNHAVLRYREPIYSTVRELALSFFHEYFKNDGRKTLRCFSGPVDLSRFDKRGWMTDEKDLWYIDEYLDKIKHYPILAPRQTRLRKASSIEIAAGKLVEWDKRGKRLFK